MDNSTAATSSTCSWATTASGSTVPRQNTSASSSSSSSSASTYQVITTTSWTGFDSNNNSSSCTNNENGQTVSATTPLVTHTQRLSPQVVVDIAELAKTIGNEFRGEFIVLPHHLVNFDHGDPVDLDDTVGGGAGAGRGEDELSSNSEDCVYAYRGDHEVNGLEEAGGLDDDDETDFLEMDFDPEPNSEQENLIQLNGYGGAVEEYHVEAINFHDWRERNEVGSISPRRGIDEAEVLDLPDNPLPGDPNSIVGGEVEDDDEENNCNDHFDPGEENKVLQTEEKEENAIHRNQLETPSKVTGTKPKVKLLAKEEHSEKGLIENSPATEEKEEETESPLPQTIPLVPVPSTSNSNDDNDDIETYPTTVAKAAEEVSCLECSELELSQRMLSMSSSSSSSAHCKKHCKKLRNSDSPITLTEDSKQIQICPNILDEENIYSSFSLLGVELHRGRLHEQVEANRLALERTKTIADYLIKYTKANCDPRRFVKLIEKCCPEEVFSELEFNFQAVAPEFNVLPVSAGQILNRWSSEQGLRDLCRVNCSKRLQTGNVLGRVANLIRMMRGKPNRSRDMEKVAPVLVPTYYRPGVLMIFSRWQDGNRT